MKGRTMRRGFILGEWVLHEVGGGGRTGGAKKARGRKGAKKAGRKRPARRR